MWDAAFISAAAAAGTLVIREVVGVWVKARAEKQAGGAKASAAETRRRQQDQEFQADQYRRLLELQQDRIERLQMELERAHGQIATMERGGTLPIDPDDAREARRKIKAIAEEQGGNDERREQPANPGGG